jgi:dienelactone hydrolase
MRQATQSPSGGRPERIASGARTMKARAKVIYSDFFIVFIVIPGDEMIGLRKRIVKAGCGSLTGSVVSELQTSFYPLAYYSPEAKMKKVISLLLALVVPCLAQEAVKTDPGPFIGEYRLENGNWITVTRMGVIDELAQPLFIDWESGRYGQLMAAGSERFVSPPATAPGTTWQTELVFSRDGRGRVTGLSICEFGGKPRMAARAEPWTDREAAIPAAGFSLAGTLRLPKARGPLPAVVLVHGSGPGTRTQLSVMASFFARLGLAVLWYDKRGCGRSGGDWKKVDLEDLAADALAGARWLRGRPEIDGKRVGLWGISQGGWITPLAGALDATVAFVINSSGPGTSLRRQDGFMMANMLKAHGVGEEDVVLALRTFDTLYDYARGKATAASLDALNEKLRQNQQLKELALPPAREITPAALYARQAIGDPAWFYHLDPDRDALAPYRKLSCPLLVTYGRLDITVPIEESAKLISETLRAAGHKDFSVELLGSAGHGFALMSAGNPPAPVQPGRISGEFFAAIENWLRQRRFCAAPGGNRDL